VSPQQCLNDSRRLIAVAEAKHRGPRLGKTVTNLEYRNLVADNIGRLHRALRGQAPGGYAVEVPEDLVNWVEWFRSPEINWGQTFATPELPADLAARYFRLRF
jgi:hypothetical protein